MTDPDQLVVFAVDQTACIGVGQCELLEPDAIRLDDDSGLAAPVEGASLPRARAEKVVERCPSAAITITAAPD